MVQNENLKPGITSKLEMKAWHVLGHPVSDRAAGFPTVAPRERPRSTCDLRLLLAARLEPRIIGQF